MSHVLCWAFGRRTAMSRYARRTHARTHVVESTLLIHVVQRSLSFSQVDGVCALQAVVVVENLFRDFSQIESEVSVSVGCTTPGS